MKDIENHKKAAKHLEEAAKHHHEAAQHLEEGNPDKAHHSMLKAFEHTALATEIQKEHLKAMI
jgi:phytoene/squalene synthetase